MAKIIKRRTARDTQFPYRYDARVFIKGKVVTRTFKRRKEADAFVSEMESARAKGKAINPNDGKRALREYADQWLKEKRPGLAIRTHELYRYLLDKHILPTFGDTHLKAIEQPEVRAWHANIAEDHPSTAAKAYRLMRTIMNTAVTDRLVGENPCQVPNAGKEDAPERPLASIAEVRALTEAMPERLRIVIDLATWCQLRRAEILGLRRKDVHPALGTLSISVTRTTTMAGEEVTKAPKSDAGRRTLEVPATAMAALVAHLATNVDPFPESLVIPESANVVRHAFDDAREAIGRTDLHLHDLRHTGLTWSAATGASVAELMKRAGHASPTVAMRYQHATPDRDRVLANALEGLASAGEVVPLTDSRRNEYDSPSEGGEQVVESAESGL